MIDFLAQSSVCLAVLYLVYYFLLRRQKTFRFNRFYLLAALVASFLFPALEIPVQLGTTSELAGISYLPDSKFIFDHSEMVVEAGEAGDPGFWSVSVILMGIYGAGVLIMLFRFLKGLVHLLCLRKTGQSCQSAGYTLIINNRVTSPFVFFRIIFLNSVDQLRNRELIWHEEVHIFQRHSWDILVVELLLIVCWFQPLIYLFRKAIALNHEFAADNHTATRTEDIYQYLNKIIGFSNHRLKLSLASNFSFVSIKNRIKMLSKRPPSQRMIILKSTLVAVVVSGLFTAFAFKIEPAALAPEKEFRVILDAGHGGEDHGATSVGGIEEKTVTLAITRKVAERFSEQKNIKVKLTRENDLYLALEERIAQTKAADLFLSIHAEYHEHGEEDFALAIYHDRNEFAPRAERMAKLSAYEFESCGKECKVGTSDFYVLENAKCPAVLLSVGYLSNKFDEEYISSASGQEKLADMIAEAIKLAAL